MHSRKPLQRVAAAFIDIMGFAAVVGSLSRPEERALQEKLETGFTGVTVTARVERLLDQYSLFHAEVAKASSNRNELLACVMFSDSAFIIAEKTESICVATSDIVGRCLCKHHI